MKRFRIQHTIELESLEFSCIRAISCLIAVLYADDEELMLVCYSSNEKMNFSFVQSRLIFF
jgi:hypothetical protein